MTYKNQQVSDVANLLMARVSDLDDKRSILRAGELKALYHQLSTLPSGERAAFGKDLNDLKNELERVVSEAMSSSSANQLLPIDVTSPMDANSAIPSLLPTENGSQHPLMTELSIVLDIFARMGFSALESRQIDDDYHMFESLNFPEGHPARDDYDTFMTEEGFIAPAHTSTMQNRVLSANKARLGRGEPIAYVIPGRVFRNEDLDARHEHTFYQLEGIYVDKDVHAGMLIATLKTFLSEYYQKDVEVKTQPFYFPFTEPSFEFALSCPFCNKAGCKVCGEGWIELLGCGMIHPHVLKLAGIDPTVYTGFAWGGGIERLVMMKYDIEDIRHFEAGRLDFLRQFK